MPSLETLLKRKIEEALALTWKALESSKEGKPFLEKAKAGLRMALCDVIAATQQKEITQQTE